MRRLRVGELLSIDLGSGIWDLGRRGEANDGGRPSLDEGDKGINRVFYSGTFLLLFFTITK